MGRHKLSLVGFEEHFWSRVERTERGCWEWQGALMLPQRYGAVVTPEGFPKETRAHRVALRLSHGPPPEGKPWASHHCDNPPCCRPDHLYWAAPLENSADRMNRGRGNFTGPKNPRRGSAHSLSKLTEKDIPVIRELREQGLSQQSIANRFGVSQALISHVLNGRNWKHIT